MEHLHRSEEYNEDANDLFNWHPEVKDFGGTEKPQHRSDYSPEYTKGTE